MAKYVPMLDPSQRADGKTIVYQYDETAGAERTIITSYWKVELSTLENIEVQHFVDTGSHILYVEFYVKSTGGAAGDHTWQGYAETEVCGDMEYDPTVTTLLADQQVKVRAKLISLLSFYRSNQYVVIANVTRDGSTAGNTGSNTISGSGVIEIL